MIPWWLIGHDSLVAAQHATLLIKNRTWLGCPGDIVFKEIGIIALGNKANLLTFRLSCYRQPHFSGNFPHLFFGKVADGEQTVSQLLLGQCVQEVGLVFALVNPPLEKI